MPVILRQNYDLWLDPARTGRHLCVSAPFVALIRAFRLALVLTRWRMTTRCVVPWQSFATQVFFRVALRLPLRACFTISTNTFCEYALISRKNAIRVPLPSVSGAGGSLNDQPLSSPPAEYRCHKTLMRRIGIFLIGVHVLHDNPVLSQRIDFARE